MRDGLAELEEVADAHGLVENDGDAADDVLERLLRSQRHGNASDAEACEGGGRIDADEVQHHEHARGDGHRVGEPAREAQHGGNLGVAGGLHAAIDGSLGCPVQQQKQPHHASDGEARRDPGPEYPLGQPHLNGAEEPADQDGQQQQPH
jgi:hypothetical protein